MNKIIMDSKIIRLTLLVCLGAWGVLSMSVSAAEDATKDSSMKKKEPKILYWVAPMDPNYRRDKPGKSPMNMDLIPVYDEPVSENSESGEPVIKFSSAVIEKLGVRTAEVTKGDLPRRIDTVGYVDYDPSRVSRITTRADGWVDRLALDSIGDRVRKGQVLFSVFSPTLVNAQEEYLQALISGNAMLRRASRERLVALGISSEQISVLQKRRKVKQWIDIRSPQDGIVTALNIREGSYVKPSIVAVELASLNSVWVVAEVFERQANAVRLGDEAVMRLTYLPGRIWKGRVSYIYPELDRKTRTLQVRLRFDNPGELIKPNMYAKIILLANPKRDAVSIPREALIRTGMGDRVIMALGDGRFTPRTVTEGIESGDRVEVLEGLKPGETVVTSAQFLLDSEASFKASMLRMTGSDKVRKSHEHGKTVSDVHSTAIQGDGEVTKIDTASHTITLSHGPIVALDWPAMVMAFPVRESVTLSGIKVGDHIGFTLVKKGNEYVISQIETHVQEGTAR